MASRRVQRTGPSARAPLRGFRHFWRSTCMARFARTNCDARAVNVKRPGHYSGWLHDLRRTLATGLQRLGVRLEVTEAVLNHLSGSRAGVPMRELPHRLITKY